MKNKMSLEEANKIAIRHGYKSYGELHQDLFRHGITLEQYVQNGESFNAEKTNRMPECVFNLISQRVIELEDKKSYLESKPQSGMIVREINRIDREISTFQNYQRENY